MEEQFTTKNTKDTETSNPTPFVLFVVKKNYFNASRMSLATSSARAVELLT